MNNKKKILYVITKSNWGGAQRYVFDLATSLDKNIFDVSVVLGGNGTLKEKLLTKNIRVFSLKSLERDINIKKEFLSMKELFEIIKKEKPDIMHLNSSKAGAIGAFVARVCGVKKIIFTAHAWAFNENRSLLLKKIIEFIHWLTVFLSHKTIAVSESVKKQISHLPFIKNKISIIHPGVQAFELKTREDSRKILDKENKNDLWIGTIAELHPVKGLMFLIQSIEFLKDENIKFYILGEGDQRETLERYIVEKNLQNKIKLCGFVEDAKSFLNAFDIFILPSLSEAFGYVVAEAGIAKLPVIASNVGGIPEIIKSGISGTLVTPKDPKAIAAAIEFYLQNESARKSHGEKLNKVVEQDFNLEKMIEKTKAVYLI